MIAVIVLSGWALYQTACFLVEDLGSIGEQGQRQFNTILLQYLLAFSLITIVMGSIIHFYFTKKLIKPIRKMITATKQMNKGNYPEPIKNHSHDEVGILIQQYNRLIEQLKNNEMNRKEFVSNISHEFRTPLANLEGYLKALKSGMIAGDEQLYAALVEEANRLTFMVDQFEQLKEWDHLHSQKIITKEGIAIHELIKQCIAMFKWQLAKCNIPYDVQVEAKDVFVQAEGIQQVISNFLDNALHYYVGEQKILIQGKVVDSYTYEVSVTGPAPAIPPEERERIFERFYRLEHSQNRKTGGSGLGLAIAKEIVENHCGKIGVKRIGVQNKFWFTIPLMED